jgi:hypothetical protein
VELARAQIAWQLKKRYVQDQALEWGVSAAPTQPEAKIAHRDAAMNARKLAAQKNKS